jgi:hypothetical protein
LDFTDADVAIDEHAYGGMWVRDDGVNRDRGEPRGSRPPTPPDVRVTYPAVRRIEWLGQPSNRFGRPSAAK